jgi:Transcriptional regulatory protein, C terminal
MVVVTCLGTWKAGHTGAPPKTAKEGVRGAPAFRLVCAPSAGCGQAPGPAGRTQTLPAREFSLLKAFAGHPGQVLSRQELLSLAWGMNFDPGTNLVDVYVGYLRRKLGETVIDTVRGTGYRLRADDQESRKE